jgi:PAS domain S-box-containing protein
MNMERRSGDQWGTRRIRVYLWVWVVFWTTTVAGLLASDIRHIRRASLDMALSEARIQNNRDQATRLWAASHGGVYVPVSEVTPPNPRLGHVPERDIVTPSGRRLTLMNPAYVLREMTGHYSGMYGISGHITSLSHLSAETAPDDWERNCLLAFEQGAKEFWDICNMRGTTYLRFMKPMYVEEDCLKCHGYQGYEVGDVRGGLSASVPMSEYIKRQGSETFAHTASFLALWIVGASVIGFTARGLIRRTRERNQAEARLLLSERKYSKVVESSLTGIYVLQDGKIVFVNPRFAEIHGYASDEMIGMDGLSLVHPSDREMVAEMRGKRFRGETAPNEYEVRGLHKNGRTVWIRRRNTLTEYEGRPAILGNEVDVTDQKMAEDELRSTEKELRVVSTRLLNYWEEERKRIAHEVHEGLAQTMSAIKYRVESALDCMPERETSRMAGLLEPVIAIVQDGVSDIRRMASRLRPLMLDDMGILPTIGWLCREVEKTHPSLRIGKTLDIEEGQIPEPLKVVIYRILENGLGLVAKNGLGGSVEISLEYEEGGIDLIVQTNRDVFALPNGPPWTGAQVEPALSTIKEFAILSGGSLFMSTGEEGGSVLHVSWPPETGRDGGRRAQEVFSPFRGDI